VETLYTIGTIEERIHRLLAEKRALFQHVIDDLSDNKLKHLLSEDELFSLFDLKPSRPKPKGNVARAGIEALRAKSPYEFEELVTTLYQRMGFSVKPTGGAHDGGVDIWARRYTDTGEESIVVQCKHYLGGKVRPEEVREFYGAIMAHSQVTRGILVTSGDFSETSKKFALGKRIDLISLSSLLGLLSKYELMDDFGKITL
jgi:restriction endonuclease Mrr